MIFAAYYSPQGIAQVPGVITALDRGDYGVLVRAAERLADPGLSLGMQFSFLCQEEAVDAPRDLVARAKGLPLAA